MGVNILGGALVFNTKMNTLGLEKGAKKTEGILDRLKGKVNSLDIYAGLGIAAVAAFGKIIDVNKEFEKSQSSLQSILGLTKDEMVFFKEASIEMGATSTKTAMQVSEAFKLIGSQKPELLKDRDALKAVTEQAIILSEAAEIDVPIAAKALTGALNQMGESADQAARYVNILAAGSKEGAADIPYLNAAIEKSGAVAADANLSFEQLTAGLEILGTKISEPTTAGLQFKDMLLRLQVAGYGMESGMFNLKDALTDVNTELDGIEDPVKKIAKETEIFGKISLVAGKTLRNNIGEYERLTTAVTDTNVALQQQKTNTDNLDGDLNKFSSTLEGVILNINSDNGLTGAIRVLVSWGIKLLENIGLIAKVLGYTTAVIISYQLATKLATLWTNRQAAASLTATVIEKAKTIAFNTQLAAIALYNAATALLTGKTKAATTQMKIFNATTKANPIGLLVGVLTAAYFAFQEFNSEVAVGNEEVAKLNKELIKEKTELYNVFDALKKTEKGSEARTVLITKANKLYGEYIPNLLTEKSSLYEIATAQQYANKALEQNFALKAKSIESEELLTKSINTRSEMTAKFIKLTTRGNAEMTKQVSDTFNAWVEESIKIGSSQGSKYQEFAKKNSYTLALQGATYIDKILAAEKEKNKSMLVINAKYSGYLSEQAINTYDKDWKILVKKLQNNLITQEQYLKEKEKLDKKYSEKPKNEKPISTGSFSENTKKADAEKEASDARNLEDFKLSILQEGTEKEIKQVELKYKRLREKAEFHNLSTADLLKSEIAEKAKITADAEKVKKDKEDKDAEKKKNDKELEYTFIQEKLLNEFLLITTDAEKIAEFEEQQKIAKLQRKLDTETKLTKIQRDAIQSRIDLLKKEKKEASKIEDLAINAAKQFGEGIAEMGKDRNKTAKENAEENKKILLNSARDVIKSALLKSLARVLEDAFAKFGIYGLVAAPVAVGAASALFNTLIPKFAEGGVVQGNSTSGDKILARVNANEVISNPKQSANLLHKISNDNSRIGGNNFDMNRVLNAQNQTNELLKSQKSAVIHGTNLKTIDRHGNLTGDMVSLSN